ncbi:hypothetical protein [Bacillus dakarensis]|uniref:hypothetical protein n=1 Tax=Robertmurraya dakarensis TaxID=1926278 RepID=UPI000981D111|nr:hypothetical protein [Bacillus dakarensis]
MIINLLCTLLFILGVYHLVRYRLNLKKAAELSKSSLFPLEEDEFRSILIPAEWKEMEPIKKSSRSYQFVKWGTVAALILLTLLLWIVITTDLLGTSFFSFAYLFFVIISAVKHRGNLFILPNGIILNGRYFFAPSIKSYEIEKIIRWHELYGLHPRVDNAYKLTLNVKGNLFHNNYVVVDDPAHLIKIIDLLEQQGIPRGENFLDEKELG